jgi:hypothetical protein
MPLTLRLDGSGLFTKATVQSPTGSRNRKLAQENNLFEGYKGAREWHPGSPTGPM